MLEYAKKHEEKLKQLYYDTAFDPFYQFEQMCAYRAPLKLADDTWSTNEFASVYNNEILGMIGYQIKRPENAVCGFYILHFGGANAPHKYIFGKDVMTAIKDIFIRYKFRKLSFSVVVGNPIEATYDRLIKRYGGRIVGVEKEDIRLLDGNLYDVKLYEILSADFFAKSYIACRSHYISIGFPSGVEPI